MGEPQRAARQQVPAERSSSPARSPAALARRSASRATGADPLQRLLSARALQPQLTVGPADDPFEREAERTASAVMAGPERREVGFGGESITASLLRPVQRAVGKGKGESEEPEKRKDEQARVQKEPSGPGPALVPAETEATITQMSRGGEPLAPSLRSFFEPRFGYDFGGTRLHSDGESGRAAMALGARAFTVGEHIFFGPGQFSPDSLSGRRLIAHELTHTIQQQPAAARAARLLRAPTRVQRAFDPLGGISATLKGWATRDFPPYDLLTIIIGRDPITDEAVKFTAPAFLHAALRLVPDGETIYADLEQNKTIEATAKWFDGELTRLDLSGEKIKALFTAAYDEAVSWANVLSPARAWEKVKAVFVPPIQRVRAFALAVGARIFAVVKTAALDKIATWAARQQGYPLLTVVLGRDPVTDEEVKRTPANLVKAVLSLVPGGDKIFEHLEKSKAIERTVAWLNGEIARLDLSWDGIKALFQKAWNAFSVKDLLNPLGLVQKLLDIFGPPARRIIKFALAAGKKVLQFIFEGLMFLAGPLGQQIVRIFHKIGGAFDKIVEDPVGFVGHLVGAVKLGFTQFEKNIAEHLKNGLIGWLVGALDRAGLVLPKVWDLKGVLDLALQILGITYAKIRIKLVKVLGEKTVGMLETAFDFVRALVVEGPAAAWQQIVDAIGSLWDMVIGGIKSWAISKIVTAAITKLATMLNPAGAVIQAIVAIYQTVAFFVERIKQIGALVESIV
ncbi:MAG TPA: DUF4157 domain-containing protein, partial [Thermomicrobiales bacterium]|nr:DUF4157 domain-containing protein [Thermomicrobiales bacterium]